MTSRERVLCALNGGTPDRVPYCELGVDEAVVRQLLDRDTTAEEPVEVEKSVSRVLNRDNICCVLRPPIVADRHVGEGNLSFYGDGKIKSRADLELLRLPDPASASVIASIATLSVRALAAKSEKS